MAKFKVGDKVEDFQRYGIGKVYKHIDGRVAVEFQNGNSPDTYMSDGRYFDFSETPSLRLAGRPFNVGDKVVIGGEKGTVGFVTNSETPANVRIDINDNDEIWLTNDGRAWPGTPIIAEHDWEEESESETGNESENHIEDVTVSQEEVLHIAEMHGKALSGQAESDILKKQHNYTRMALSLTGFKLDKEAAALITETVKKVLELGGEFSLDTACEVEARVNKIYDEANI